ncbi:hypothetical protein ABNN70_05840 [Sporolactobacillus sp. Y61]|uniref:DUF5085 family protein n=1 Tax=Sporolactobacillus sp. Y61 TaxID=3160863 RepID=A0AAU8IHT2_9BACL
MIKQSSLVLLNLLSRKVICRDSSWYEEGEELRRLALESGVYPNGPLVMTAAEVPHEPEFTEYTVYLPVSSPLSVDGDDSPGFLEMLQLRRTLVFRHYEADEPFTHTCQMIEAYAQQHRIILDKPFYHVCLEVNGDVFFDIHAPVKEVTVK